MTRFDCFCYQPHPATVNTTSRYSFQIPLGLRWQPTAPSAAPCPWPCAALPVTCWISAHIKNAATVSVSPRRATRFFNSIPGFALHLLKELPRDGVENCARVALQGMRQRVP